VKAAPLVFLDLDGVVRLMCDAANAGAYPPDLLACPGQPPSYFDFACVRRLNQLLDDTDAQFVIISTLRLVHPWPKLMHALQQAGIPLWRMHQDTGLPWSGDRGRDIMQWLARNQDVTNWCVLDDELALPDDCHMDIVFDMFRFHPDGAAGRVVGAGMPMAAIGDTGRFAGAWACAWILEQCLREQEQAYVPGPLHELVVAQTNLHTAPLWLVHWTPTTFNIEPW